MNEEAHQLTTDQAEREASGAHEYGRYLEEFEVGAVYKHWPAKTITESEDHLFCLLTMNHHPLHINDVYASKSQQGRNVVAGPYVYSLMFGMTVNDVSGKAIANLATDELSHPNPVFHGDTTANLSVVVNPPVSVTTTSLAAGVIGAGYNQTLRAAGGISPLGHYSRPVAGLSLNAGTGAITGTPTGPLVGVSSFTVTATDSESPAKTATASLSIAPRCDAERHYQRSANWCD